MKSLRHRFERFCFRNRNKGIPNLMLFVCLGAAITYLFTYATNNYIVYYYLSFSRELILQGQVWRLLTYPLVYNNGDIVFTLIAFLCYYSLGRAMENLWGTFKFNLFYLSGMAMMDIYCMIFGGAADAYYLNLSLFLGYATLYPDAHFLLFFIIPVKAWIFALLDLVLTLSGLFFDPFPSNLFSVICIGNYLLFFGKDVLNVIPLSWRINAARLFGRNPKSKGSKVVPFPTAGSYQATTAKPKASYSHRCTVCGRTDESNPELEFRYCSKCRGYCCYCSDHISNHSHIQ